jgi:hypothetical protein
MEGVFERIMDGDGPSGVETGKWGGFSPPPDELIELGAEVKFEFDTPMSEAYRRLKLEKAQEANAYIQSRIATNPDIVDLVDQDEMDSEALKAVLPAKAMRKREDVDAMRQEKQQKALMEQAAQLALQAGGAGGGGNGAPALPGADPTGGMGGAGSAGAGDVIGQALAALRGLRRGRATDGQQRTAVAYVMTELCGVGQVPFTGESSHATAFRAGSLAVGIAMAAIADVVIMRFPDEIAVEEEGRTQ